MLFAYRMRTSGVKVPALQHRRAVAGWSGLPRPSVADDPPESRMSAETKWRAFVRDYLLNGASEVWSILPFYKRSRSSASACSWWRPNHALREAFSWPGAIAVLTLLTKVC